MTSCGLITESELGRFVHEFGTNEGFFVANYEESSGRGAILLKDPIEKLIIRGDDLGTVERFTKSGGIVAGALFYELFDKGDAPKGVLYRYKGDATLFAGERSAVAAEKKGKVSFESDFAKEDYLAAIVEILAAIQKGDVYQVNFSHRIKITEKIDPRALFLKVNSMCQGARRAYLSCRIGKVRSIVSASPERFFSITNDQILSSPIKGTRPRGISPESDLKLREELLKSEKDRAELAMVVDVVRNDMTKIAQVGTVNFSNHAHCESNPSVHHLVTDVAATLKESVGFLDIIKALFPFASITGAPKLAAIDQIRKMERSARGVYTGAIGWWSNEQFSDLPRAHFNVAIRTAEISEQEMVFGVGGGITNYSDPESEYNETLAKAESLLSAL